MFTQFEIDAAFRSASALTSGRTKAAGSISRFCLVLVVLSYGGCGRRSPEPTTLPESKPQTKSTSGDPQAPAPKTTDQRRGDYAWSTEESGDRSGEAPLSKDDAPSNVQPNMGTEQESPAENFFDADWTTRRLIALAPGGAMVIDLSICVDGENLLHASESVTDALADELMDGLEPPVQWRQLLEVPLIKSGWLGNLIADEDQVDQLVGMYDTQRDDIVTRDELPAFLSRGLARNAPLQIRDAGRAPDSLAIQSPWGPADTNKDYALDAQEIEQLPAAVLQLDFNGDKIVTFEELEQAVGMRTAQSMVPMSLLETTTLVFTDEEEPTPNERQKQNRRIASTVLGHYTFLEAMPRDEWYRWSPARWQELDTNKDDLLDRSELEQLLSINPVRRVYVRFPSSSDDTGKALIASRDGSDGQSVDTESHKVSGSTPTPAIPPATGAWFENDVGGTLRLPGCIVQLQIEDTFHEQIRKLLRQRLSAALNDAQLQAFLRSQLQLQEGAFELLDADGDAQLSDEEFAAAWRWLSSRQGTRILARWMTVSQPWFHLLDEDGNSRLTMLELQKSASYLEGLETSGDRLLTPDELPLLANLEVQREDSRLAALRVGPASSEQAATAAEDWFSAMDTNRDGVVSRVEFLGSIEDFENLDGDKDGFLTRIEVY